MTLASTLHKNCVRTAVAVAAVAACSGVFAADLPQFTFDPAAVGLNGTSFDGDNIIISDFSTVTFDGAGMFQDTGYLAVSAIQLGGNTFTPDGLNSTYGIYIKFDGAGTTTVGDPAMTPTIGTFTSLTYTVYGYNGTATFGFSGNTPTETAMGEIELASGSLINGTATTIPTGDGSTFNPSAAARLTFNTAAGASGFFAAPQPFYDLAFSAFTNTTSQVEAFDGGFRIRQGGGAFNFASTPPVPEPETYALMLAGLGAVGFVARRRRAA